MGPGGDAVPWRGSAGPELTTAGGRSCRNGRRPRDPPACGSAPPVAARPLYHAATGRTPAGRLSRPDLPSRPEEVMATLVLRSAGAAIGTALGGPLGGLVGGALGAVGGAVVDNLLANALAPRRDPAPQLDAVAITHAEEGAPVRKLWGRMRLGGNVIWCTQFQAVTAQQKTSGARARASARSTTKVTTSSSPSRWRSARAATTSRSAASGPTATSSTSANTAITSTTAPRPRSPTAAIESVEGTGAVPAYRGHSATSSSTSCRSTTSATACRRSPPRSSAARRSPIPTTSPTRCAPSACCPAPASSCSARRSTSRRDGFGNWYPENVHTPNGIPDFYSSLDQLDATLPDRASRVAGGDVVRHGPARRRLPDRPQGRDAHQDRHAAPTGRWRASPARRRRGEPDRSRHARPDRASNAGAAHRPRAGLRRHALRRHGGAGDPGHERAAACGCSSTPSS